MNVDRVLVAFVALDVLNALVFIFDKALEHRRADF